MKESSTIIYTKANKAAWDASAHLHAQGRSWDELLQAASHPDFNVLDDCLTATLTHLGLAGRNAVQIGCNNARELLSLAALGFKPSLGIDQSSRFLAQGAELASKTKLNPRLLEANIYQLPTGLGRYDLALITIGVINWMPDLQGFFKAVRGLVSKGGRLVIYETHPILEVFDPAGTNPFLPEMSYFDKSPVKIEEAITYDGTSGGAGETGYWFVHTLGDIVTACVGNGFQIQRLEEHAHSNREEEYAIYENQSGQLPLCYTLVAQAV
ncbi:class I SAM-dependent methyltransferase [Marinobacterium litorale]|uniref:class I SAM-dependent methyltransferase n=1 Tax=Marinobacterium litorale TaxID=404770 RepID=UPI0003F7555D|nr:class I SAM-dependent methyltransferase [Marinobacterium litorale]